MYYILAINSLILPIFIFIILRLLSKTRENKQELFDKYIRIYENTLEPEFCKKVIDRYNKDPRKVDGITGGGLMKHIKDTTDLCFSKYDDWNNIDEVFYKSLTKYLEIYTKEINSMHQNDLVCNKTINFISENVKDTGYQIQKYIANTGKYIWHQDFMVEIRDGNNLGRMLTFLWYLNDVEEGGETEFISGFKVKPKTGSLCIFPATWTYGHRGCMPISNDKYIVTGWIWNIYNNNIITN